MNTRDDDKMKYKDSHSYTMQNKWINCGTNTILELEKLETIVTLDIKSQALMNINMNHFTSHKTLWICI